MPKMRLDKNIYAKYVERMSEALAEDGHILIKQAFEGSDYNHNKTQNLHDSYGSCVFYNGKEVSNTRRYVGRKATVGKIDPIGNIVLGRAEIDSFFDGYKAKSKGFELVLAAAIFYGQILEDGSGKLKRKYRVISFMADKVENVARKYGGTVNRIQEGKRV
jgi:hypothetical protein